ncbi:hypothetical protein BDD12DRAFT_804988 [Trichophaea hybrida]|nr:hypothetical protein BDD12DRAFT_804988 [Trichophaea hybrida]
MRGYRVLSDSTLLRWKNGWIHTAWLVIIKSIKRNLNSSDNCLICLNALHMAQDRPQSAWNGVGKDEAALEQLQMSAIARQGRFIMSYTLYVQEKGDQIHGGESIVEPMRKVASVLKDENRDDFVQNFVGMRRRQPRGHGRLIVIVRTMTMKTTTMFHELLSIITPDVPRLLGRVTTSDDISPFALKLVLSRSLGKKPREVSLRAHH